ncbi:MAG: hypothetical protein QOG38_1785 [Hyphomicrobiales bacterium]|nr:hypothetical protein [Hyphomicrobiales bacterium]
MAAAFGATRELRLGRIAGVAYLGAMRAGALISAIAHAGVVAWVLLGTPKPFDVASGEPVAVDLVPSEQAPPEVPKAPEKPDTPKPKPEAETPPLLIPPRPTTVTQSTQTALASPPHAEAATPARPLASKARPQASPAPRSALPPQPPAEQPQRNAAVPPSPAAAPASPAAAPPSAPTEAQSIFDPASIPKLADIAPQPAAPTPVAGFDALADVAAALSRQEVTDFKAHLKKCLKLPAGVDAARDLRVVMRVFLKPDGALASDPMLVAAPAAREGPAMVQAAMQAFKACQPYSFPAEKYNDWKVLDISLSPRDMAGG